MHYALRFTFYGKPREIQKTRLQLALPLRQ